MFKNAKVKNWQDKILKGFAIFIETNLEGESDKINIQEAKKATNRNNRMVIF